MSRGLLTLAIETSNPSAAGEGSGPGVAAGLVSPGGVEVLGVEMLRTAGRHDDDLMAAVDRLWAGVGLPKREIERVAVSVGPGGYTGLRIAVVAAKLIAEATGALCAPVPSALVVASRAPADLPAPFGVALASKGETAVVTVFSREREAVGGPREVDSAALALLGVRGLIADSHLPASIRERCARAGIRVDAPVFDPAACLEASASIEPVEPARLAPLYGREPEAVRKWRELKRRSDKATE